MSYRPIARDPRAVELGARIERARMARGWHQVRLGVEMGVTRHVVSQWESGYETLTDFQVAQIERALGLPIIHEDVPAAPAPRAAKTLTRFALDCANDGRPFNSADPDARYCRPACQAAAIRRQQRQAEMSRP